LGDLATSSALYLTAALISYLAYLVQFSRSDAGQTDRQTDRRNDRLMALILIV